MSQEAPLQDGFGKRVTLRRTRVQLCDRRLMLYPVERRDGDEIIRLDRKSEVVTDNAFCDGKRRCRKRFAATQIGAITVLFVFGRCFLAVAGSVFRRRCRLRQHAADGAMVRRVKPGRRGDERHCRADKTGDRQLLHRWLVAEGRVSFNNYFFTEPQVSIELPA